ncbi:hypothetical protein D3C81_2180440 [compost metagenome]
MVWQTSSVAKVMFSAISAASHSCGESSKAPIGSMNWVSRMKCSTSFAQQPRIRKASTKNEKKLVRLFSTLRTSSAASAPLSNSGSSEAG